MFASPIPSHNAASAPPTQPATPAAAAAPLRHAVVLNWEDVLVPMTLLAQRLGLQSTRQAMEGARALLAQDAYFKQALATVEDQAIALITTAAGLGPVFVVTDKSLKYMEILCAVFLPRLGAFLLQANMPGAFAQYHTHLHRIRVVAAPRKFTSLAEVTDWKVNVFQSVCADQLQRDTNYPFSLIAVSASDRDALACIGAAQKTAASLALPKCIQVFDPTTAEHAPLSIEVFFAQLQTLQRYIGTAAAHGSAFSTRL